MPPEEVAIGTFLGGNGDKLAENSHCEKHRHGIEPVVVTLSLNQLSTDTRIQVSVCIFAICTGPTQEMREEGFYFVFF